MNILQTVLLFAGLFLCHSMQSQLSEAELRLVSQLGFDARLMELVRQETGHEIQQLPAIEAETGSVTDGVSNGLHSQYDKEESYEAIVKLKPAFRAKGYLLFLFSDDDERYSIAVIKGNEEADIVEFRKTDAANFDLDNRAIVARLKQWKALSNFEVLGCASDWVTLSFRTLPKDLSGFAKEIYAFCPDVVDQASGDLASLEKTLRDFRRLNLWWD